MYSEHGGTLVEFYETPAGRWGMSSPGIWINDDAQREHALALIATYQAERAARARREYEEQKARGEHSTWRDVIRRHPVRFVGALLAAAFVVYVTVGPFLRLAGRD